MKIRWLGTSCFEAELSKLTVLMDPYLDSRASFNPPPATVGQFKHLDLITITHGHFDHFSDAIKLLKSTEAVLVASSTLCNYAKSELKLYSDRVLAIDIDESLTFKGVKIIATKAIHPTPLSVMQWYIGNFFYQPSDSNELKRMYFEIFPREVLDFSLKVPTGPLQGYLFEETGGLRLWNASETSLFEGWEQYVSRLKPHIALVAVGGGFEKVALELVEKSRPKIVIPHSFDEILRGQALLGNLELFKEEVYTIPNVEVLVPKLGEWYSF